MNEFLLELTGFSFQQIVTIATITVGVSILFGLAGKIFKYALIVLAIIMLINVFLR